jgi:hypothetical protein
MNKIKCFISYSWDSQKHKKWVRLLAEKLQENGIFTILDQWDVSPGTQLTKYMESSIRDSNYTILICTPRFAEKANLGKGGVGYEKCIVTGEIFTDSDNDSKYIAILREGNPKTSLPSYLKSKMFIDFTNDQLFYESLEELLRCFYCKPKYVRPVLGEKPNFRKSMRNNSITKSKDSSKQDSILKFKLYFTFAESIEGLCLGSRKAEEWADNHYEYFQKNSFDIFFKLFLFALSIDGLCMGIRKAEKWAFTYNQYFEKNSFKKFNDYFNFAKSIEGLCKGINASEIWAFSKMNKT